MPDRPTLLTALVQVAHSVRQDGHALALLASVVRQAGIELADVRDWPEATEAPAGDDAGAPAA